MLVLVPWFLGGVIVTFIYEFKYGTPRREYNERWEKHYNDFHDRCRERQQEIMIKN